MEILIIMPILALLINHPLIMGITLLIQSTMIALMTGKLINFWFSYILFMIMVGGMLVILIYMTSVASNEKWNFKTLYLLVLTILPMNMLIKEFTYENSLTSSLSSQLNFSINKFFTYPSLILYLIMINLLLIMLIAVVKITKQDKGPMRTN